MPFSTYQRDQIGTAVIEPAGPLEAGSFAPVTITFTAGKFGIDDTGGIKICYRTASDSGKLQFTDPRAPNYCTAEASNGAALELSFTRNNIRPYPNTLQVRVGRGFLRAGETITVRLGDTRKGSPGYRLQTAVETEFVFKVYCDAFATYDFVELAKSPIVKLVSGPPRRYKALLPTLRRKGEPFRLCLVADDRWGNVSDKAAHRVRLKANMPVEGLPETVTFEAGKSPPVIEGLRLAGTGDLRIDMLNEAGELLVRSNPMRVVDTADLVHFWGDLHGQSGETVGTGTVQEYFAFARDKAFIDIVGHQGNDFQIGDDLWEEINRLAREYDKPGHMVALPGYEWSGNTGMGGDRNVFYRTEGRPIRRSSSVLLDAPRDTDCHHVNDLFKALENEDAIVLAHVGGRYADIGVGHDGRLERAVEIHSCWGTFEWMLHDAIKLGYRVGIVCHSDDHKGRPGAAHPGASNFGAIGGLTCYMMPKLDRDALFTAVKARRTYGTTGTRLFIDAKAHLGAGAEVLSDDPLLGPVTSTKAETALVGDIARVKGDTVRLDVEALGATPIERVTFFHNDQPVAVVRGYDKSKLGSRIRVLFEGAEYRGRGREVLWKGTVRLKSNRFLKAKAINHFNADKPLKLGDDGSQVDVDTVTTGNFSGFDIWLEDASAGFLDITTNLVCKELKIADIGLEDHVVDLGGLGRRLRVFRLPDVNDTWALKASHTFKIDPQRDNALYMRLTQEDGHQAWTSPVYIIP
ncbi:MAG: DUF3604 domain-containing protein [Hyphomicrobiaceae bacterium]